MKTFDATAMVTGNMIGSGIFVLSGYAAGPVSGGGALLLAWIFGGVMALLGALAIAELATRFPHTGGDFLYLHNVYGPYPSFLYGWMGLVITESGSIALLALFSAKYLTLILPATIVLPEQVLACGLILFFTLLHGLRVTVGARFQSLLTVLKVAGILGLAVLLYTLPGRPVTEPTLEIEAPVQGFALALIPVFWAYTGWNVAGYVAGEIAQPRRILPVALIGGTLIPIMLYFLLTGAFLRALGIDALRGDAMVPETALEAVGALKLKPFLLGLILLSVVSSLSIAVQSGARILKAMGEKGIFFKITARLQPRTHTPLVALLIQGLWSCFLVVWFLNIERLVYSTAVVMVLFSLLTVSTLFRARKQTGPEVGDHFQTPFFPLVPVAYISSAVFIAWGVIKFYLDQGDKLPFWGLGWILAGTVVFLIWRWVTATRRSPYAPED